MYTYIVHASTTFTHAYPSHNNIHLNINIIRTCIKFKRITYVHLYAKKCVNPYIYMCVDTIVVVHKITYTHSRINKVSLEHLKEGWTNYN